MANYQADGKLHVSLTKVYDGKNMVANTFDSRQELIEVVLASCFIPVFSGIVPARYRGHRVIGEPILSVSQIISSISSQTAATATTAQCLTPPPSPCPRLPGQLTSAPRVSCRGPASRCRSVQNSNL